MQLNPADIAIEFVLAFVGIILFYFVGRYFLEWILGKTFNGKYGGVFHPLIAGLLIIIGFYAIVFTKGITILTLLLPLLFLFYRNQEESFEGNGTAHKVPIVEMAFIALLSVVILHLFPDSEYKQADSFFYLKIAESLNQTGQENISHYCNNLMNIYHGVEPYHYFEIWVTSFFIKLAGGFYNHIAVARFVTHGVFLSGIIIGLYFLIELLNKGKVSWWQKIFCFALLFFMPNILNFFTGLYRFFISDFEGNLLERPNFRIIYLLLIPVIAEFIKYRKLTKSAFYILLILCVATFKCGVVLIPALVVYGILLRIFFRQKVFVSFWPVLVIFCIAFGLFYYALGAKSLPGLFEVDAGAFFFSTISGWKFILFSMGMSVIYILLIGGVFLLPVLFFKRSDVEWNKPGILLMAITGAVGLAMARILYLKDNAYQFLFLTHIIVSIAVWLLFVLFLLKGRSKMSWLFATFFLSFLFFLRILVYPKAQVDTFRQNGNFVYEGKKYSAVYVDKVGSFLRANEGAKGAYIAGKEFYTETYYSRRNPNVYFLPITYIMTSKVNNNIEFCISDSATIMVDVTQPVFTDYLQNAIARSAFYQFQKQNPQLQPEMIGAAFIRKFGLSYMIATKDAELETGIQQMVKNEWVDEVTGERFYVLSDVR